MIHASSLTINHQTLPTDINIFWLTIIDRSLSSLLEKMASHWSISIFGKRKSKDLIPLLKGNHWYV